MKTTRFKNMCLCSNKLAVWPWLCALRCTLWLAAPGTLRAQDFGIDWFAVAGGGGNSSGGDFELSATIGLSDADTSTPSGGDFAFTGGFWSIVAAVETPNSPTLSVSLDQGSVIISWPETGSASFSLEETGALGDPNSWGTVNAASQPSNGTQSVRLPLAAGNHFYRLHKP